MPVGGCIVTTYSVEPNDRVTFKVLYEDADLVVVIKPPGVVTQPGLGHDHDSLLNGFFARWGDRLQALGRARDFGLLHRLDRQTSGLVLAALRPASYDALRLAFTGREVRKFYWAVIRGVPRVSSGIIRKPISESPGRDGGAPPPEGRRGTGKAKKKLAWVSSGGKPAVTAYRVLQSSASASLIECRTLTGRLHQVRVHMEAINCPIMGDGLYGPPAIAAAAPRLALHAHRLVFKHPTTGVAVDINAPWPPDLRALLKKLGLNRPDLAPATKSEGGVERLHELEGDAVGEEEPLVGEGPSGV